MASTLQDRIVFLAAAHGSLRQLSKAIGIDAGYLQRLKDGEKDNPSDDVLDKLGLTRQVVYAVKPKAHPHD